MNQQHNEQTERNALVPNAVGQNVVPKIFSNIWEMSTDMFINEVCSHCDIHVFWASRDHMWIAGSSAELLPNICKT